MPVPLRRWLLSSIATLGVYPVEAAQLPRHGCAAWQRVAALELAGSIEQGGLKGRYTLLLDPHEGRSVTAREFGAFSERAGFDGQVGWAQDRSGASHQLNAAAARAISTTEAWLLRRGWCNPVDARVEPMPPSGAEALWRVVPQQGIPVVLRFDRASGRLRAAEYRLWGNRLIRHYDDWRDVGAGVEIAFSERDEDPEDEDSEVIALAAARLGREPPAPTAFARPPRPEDYEILGGARSTTLGYEDDGGARIYVPVFINGNGPHAFELDTGGHLIVGRELAAALGLQSVGSFANTGAGTAITQTGVASNLEVRIGEAVLHRQVAKTRPFYNDRISGKSPRAGLLGLELFERFAVQVDRAARTVTLTPLEKFTGGSGTALPIYFIEDAPLTAGSYDGHPGDFEIDSGAAGPSIIEGYWAHQLGLDVALSQGLAWGAGTGANAYDEWLSRGEITLGPLRFPHQLVSYVGQPVRGSESTHLQAGLAGEWLLHCHDTTYDYGHGVVWVGAPHECPALPFNHAGVRVALDHDTLVATAVAPGTPAAAAGMARGDRIVSIAGRDASTLSTRDAAALLAGPVGSELQIVWVPAAGGAARTVRLKLAELVP